jgi:NADH-quinone oxidoreductase subunit K
MNSSISIGHFAVLSAILFGIGFLTVLTRKNVVAILMGVELLFNAAALQFVAFSRYVEGSVGGQVFALFIIVIAAAEAAVALAIVLSIHRQFRSIDADEASRLRN